MAEDTIIRFPHVYPWSNEEVVQIVQLLCSSGLLSARYDVDGGDSDEGDPYIAVVNQHGCTVFHIAKELSQGDYVLYFEGEPPRRSPCIPSQSWRRFA